MDSFTAFQPFKQSRAELSGSEFLTKFLLTLASCRPLDGKLDPAWASSQRGKNLNCRNRRHTSSWLCANDSRHIIISSTLGVQRCWFGWEKSCYEDEKIPNKFARQRLAANSAAARDSDNTGAFSIWLLCAIRFWCIIFSLLTMANNSHSNNEN